MFTRVIRNPPRHVGSRLITARARAGEIKSGGGGVALRKLYKKVVWTEFNSTARPSDDSPPRPYIFTSVYAIKSSNNNSNNNFSLMSVRPAGHHHVNYNTCTVRIISYYMYVVHDDDDDDDRDGYTCARR